jgi:putative restriction endonuclease
MAAQRPLIEFHGIVPGRYLAAWPAYVVADDPVSLTFTVAVDERQAFAVGVVDASTEDVRRRYVTRLARQRLHQNAFRIRVLRAYREHLFHLSAPPSG